jgi:capsular exopolysaccharide synthesis family protein
MGRIADAMKRAEQERRQMLGPAMPAATDEAPPTSPLAAAEERGAIEGAEATGSPHVYVEGLHDSLIPFFERSSLVTEQYRSLRTRLLSLNPNYEHRVLAITSAVPKEGKSVTTLNVGCILAEIRHLRVLVVDGDFRRSSLARMLNQTNDERPGLADILRGEATYEDALRPTPIANLKFIAAGRTQGQSPAELLTSGGTARIFKRMQHDFHYTLVDTPPATTVTDAGIIAQLCSGVIVVIRLHHTDEFAAKRGVRLLQVTNVPIVGCVVVGRDAPAGRYGYGYGYGYGYNSYRYYDYYENKNDQS